MSFLPFLFEGGGGTQFVENIFCYNHKTNATSRKRKKKTKYIKRKPKKASIVKEANGTYKKDGK